MNCSSCGEPLRISDKVYCSDCREKRDEELAQIAREQPTATIKEDYTNDGMSR